jgi:tetratricopeptide (TPR) repeat protein
MDAILKPLERVREAITWFMAATEQRLLYLQTSEALRVPILAKLASLEGHPRCKRAVVVLEAGVDPNDDGWTTRTEELEQGMSAARDRAAAADPALEIRPLGPTAGASTGVATFARTLRAALAAVEPPLEGLLVVLAPAWVSDANGWRATLAPLLARPEFGRARFVVVDTEDGPARPVAEALGPRAEIAEARIDPAAAKQAIAAMVAAMASAPPGAEAARAAGLAGPRELPPRRAKQPPPLTPEQKQQAMEKLDLPAAYADPEVMQQIRLAVMQAADAMGDGRAIEAVRFQRQARDLALAARLVREPVLFEIMVGAYALQAGAPEQALAAFDVAAGRAKENQLPELAAQALLAKAGALLTLKRTDVAAVAYAEAGHAAVTKAPALAIEGYRMSGTLLLSLRQEQQAIAVWKRALQIADGIPPKDRGATTASEVARALAAVCRNHGLRVQADALERQAQDLETPAATAGGA